MTRDHLFGIRLKLDRAEQQLKALEADFDTFLRRKPYGITPQYNVAKRELRLIGRIAASPPGFWGIQIGEIVHNLRSALDHLIWELVIHHTGAPPTSNKSQFPIFKTEAGYDKRAQQFVAGIAPQAGARIRSLQPYATGEGAGSPLWRLHELSNFDKHRTIHLTGAVLEAGDIKFSGLKPGIKCYITSRVPGPLIDNTPLLKMTFEGGGWPFKVPMSKDIARRVKVDGPTRVDVAFDDGCTAVAWGLVRPLLHAIGARVYSVIDLLANDFLGVKLKT